VLGNASKFSIVQMIYLLLVLYFNLSITAEFEEDIADANDTALLQCRIQDVLKVLGIDCSTSYWCLHWHRHMESKHIISPSHCQHLV